ncbi:Leucine rich repeat-containing protein [Ruminococcaceae bacterium FB2012]|nr:Leucine rich repeat-containing protein [Ruminococcaceae bacterium FB2012]
MNMKKKMLSGLLALTLVFGGAFQAAPWLSELSPVLSVSADEYQGFVYEDMGGMIMIRGYNGTKTEITVPAEIDNTPVAGIGYEAFANNTSITKVTLSEGISNIGDDAFKGCTALKTVVLPDGLQSIGMWAFMSCISLTDITIPDSVWGLGKYAFDSCTSLKSINVPAKVWDVYPDSFNRCRSLTSINVAPGNASCCTINGMLYNKAGTQLLKAPCGLTSAVIPEGTESINAEAFNDCPKLQSVTLPDSLTSIGKMAFHDCPSLKELTISEKVESIGSTAIGFYYDNGTHAITPVDGLVIYCWYDSAAYKYAVENDIAFVLLDTVRVKGKTVVNYDKPFDLSKLEYQIAENGIPIDIYVKHGEDGRFSVQELPAGKYTFTAYFYGFPEESVDFTVSPDQINSLILYLYHFGDVNSDGAVNMKDLALLQRWVNGWDVEINEKTANMITGDKINMKDITSLQRFINGWDIVFR